MNENVIEKTQEEVASTPTIVTMEERDMNKISKKQKVVKICVTTLV